MERNKYYKMILPGIIFLLIGYAVFTKDIISLLLGSLHTVLTAFIIVYLLNPIVNFIERKTPLKRGFSILLTFVLCTAIIILSFAALLPPLAASIRSFVDAVPKYLQELESGNFLSTLPVLDQLDFNGIFDKATSFIMNYAGTFAKNLMNIAQTATGVVSILFNFLLAIFMAYYALYDTEKMCCYTKRLLYALSPKRIADFLLRATGITDKAFKDFIIGKIVTCLILGVMTWVGILLVNLFVPGITIPYAPLIGFIIGLTNIIPYVGPFFGTVPCFVICLFTGLPESIAFLVVILIAQQIDNIYVGPKILGDSLGVSAFWVVASVAVGGSLFGAVGMVLSVPIVAVIQQLLLEFIENRESKGYICPDLIQASNNLATAESSISAVDTSTVIENELDIINNEETEDRHDN